MKIKSVIMMMVAAVAAFVASADSEPSPTRWYNGGVETGWPNARSLKSCSWQWNTAEADAEFKDGYIEIDSDMSNYVNCVANRNADLLKGKVEHSVTYIPYVEQNKLEYPEPEDAKTAFAILVVSNELTDVVSSNYYCLAKDTTTNKWVQLSGATYAGGEITLKFAMKYVTSENKAYANYTVTPTGGTAVDLTYLGTKDIEIVIADTKCRGVSFAGSGKVGSTSASKYVKGTSLIPGMMFNR